MDRATALIREKIKKCDGLDEKLSVLKGAYTGKTAYILTCGPSFGNYTADYLRKRLKDELVISVKQTYDTVGDIADFHLLNSWNYKKYDYAEPRPILLAEKHPVDPETPFLLPDLLFPLINAGSDLPLEEKLQKRLCVAQNFEDYLFEKTINRPLGPGIVYELGFYLAVHLGVSKIIIVGWDIGIPDSQIMPHFYKEGEHLMLNKLPANLLRKGKLVTLQPGGKSIVRDLEDSDLKLINTPGFYDDEVEKIAASTSAIYKWLLSKGIELEIVSDRSLASDEIPRSLL